MTKKVIKLPNFPRSEKKYTYVNVNAIKYMTGNKIYLLGQKMNPLVLDLQSEESKKEMEGLDGTWLRFNDNSTDLAVYVNLDIISYYGCPLITFLDGTSINITGENDIEKELNTFFDFASHNKF